MAREVFDDGPVNPAVNLLRGDPPAASPIAQEREEPGSPGWAFLVATAGLAFAVTVLGLLLVGKPLQPAEVAWQESFAGLADVHLRFGRVVSAVAAGVAVVAAAMLGRRFGHSEPAGLLCALLVALDPGFLVAAHLAIPDTLAFAGLLGALALFLTPTTWMHWVGAGSLTLAALADPAAVLWGVPLGLLLLLRGHIYASPQHLGTVGVQVGVLPLVGAGLHWALDGTLRSVPACLDTGRLDALFLHKTLLAGPSMAFLHGPVTWLVGAGVLLLTGGGGLLIALLRFRAARAPGRVQVRLTVPFHPFLGRGLWLLLLAAFAPTPLAWLVLFALALALGVLELADDAPGFGLAIALVLVAFAGLVLARSWAAVTGTGGAEGIEDALGIIPWTQTESC